MKLYTKFGDEGETALCDGTRVFKNDLRVCAYGTVDELNAILGWCRIAARAEMADRLDAIQQELFVLGAQLATPAKSQCLLSRGIGPEHVQQLETWIDEATAAVEPLQHFVLPGGSELAARLHVARTVCRRTEREVIALHRVEPVSQDIIVYLNRLGDLLFAWSRQANWQANCPETQWIPQNP